MYMLHYKRKLSAQKVFDILSLILDKKRVGFFHIIQFMIPKFLYAALERNCYTIHVYKVLSGYRLSSGSMNL